MDPLFFGSLPRGFPGRLPVSTNVFPQNNISTYQVNRYPMTLMGGYGFYIETGPSNIVRRIYGFRPGRKDREDTSFPSVRSLGCP